MSFHLVPHLPWLVAMVAKFLFVSSPAMACRDGCKVFLCANESEQFNFVLFFQQTAQGAKKLHIHSYSYLV